MIRTTFTAMPPERWCWRPRPPLRPPLSSRWPCVRVVSFEVGQRILAAKHVQVALSHPVPLRPSSSCVAPSLSPSSGSGSPASSAHRRAVTALAMLILGGAIFRQMVPAGLRQYIPGIAVQAARNVHRSAGLLRPGAPSCPVRLRRHRPPGGISAYGAPDA